MEEEKNLYKSLTEEQKKLKDSIYEALKKYTVNTGLFVDKIEINGNYKNVTIFFEQ